MSKRILAALGLVAAFTLTATAAQAVERTDVPSTIVVAYTPDDPTEPSLAGSIVGALCEADVPWIDFSLVLSDPEGLSTGTLAMLTISDGAGNLEQIPLGDLDDGVLEGRTLWPGASIDDEGSPTGWPGWAFENGEWVSVGDANFGWTRSGVTATITVNPEITAPLSYPPPTPECISGPRVTDLLSASTLSGEGEIASTGLATPVGMLAIGAGLLVVLGAGLLVMKSMRRSSAK